MKKYIVRLKVNESFEFEAENIEQAREEAEQITNQLIDNISEDSFEVTEVNICSICKKKYEGFGNNAFPVNKGRCCDECNTTEIISARLKKLNKLRSK